MTTSTLPTNRRKIFKIVLVTLFIGAFILLFVPFFAEILLAVVVAFAMEPVMGKIAKYRPMGLRWKPSVAMALAVMFLALATPVSIVFYKLYAQVTTVSKTGIQQTEAYTKIVKFKTGVIDKLNHALESAGLEDRVDLSAISEDGIGRVANFGLNMATGFFYQIPSFLLSLFVFCAALYFFLADNKNLRKMFLNQGLLSEKETDRFVHLMQSCCQSTVVTSVLIALMQATLVGIASLIFSGGDFFVVWVVTFFCSFIPVIGAGPVALALGLYKAVLGEYGAAIGFAVFALIAGTSDNLVRPYLISAGQEDLHPIVSLLAIIGALIIFGMSGLFLGPVIATVAIRIIPTLYNERLEASRAK